MLHARKIGKDTWVALCPAHPDRHPSLTIKVGRKVPIVLKCQSNGCSVDDICGALGIKVTDLFYDRAVSPAIRVQMTLEQHREALTEKYLSARLLADMEPQKRNYWRAIERRAYADLQWVRCQLEPMEVYREWKGRQWQRMTMEQKKAELERVYYRHILPHRNPVVEV